MASAWPLNSTTGSSTPMSKTALLQIAPMAQRSVTVAGVLKSQIVLDGLLSSSP
jgi:hypothetical protein